MVLPQTRLTRLRFIYLKEKQKKHAVFKLIKGGLLLDTKTGINKLVYFKMNDNLDY